MFLSGYNTTRNDVGNCLSYVKREFFVLHQSSVLDVLHDALRLSIHMRDSLVASEWAATLALLEVRSPSFHLDCRHLCVLSSH